MGLLDDLNDAQRRAVEACDGSILIVAGPGTGKTKTLTARIAWLIEGGQVKPDEIVALTFTNKAAREMRERVVALLGMRTGLPKITTFHALGADLLKQHKPDAQLIDERQRMEIIRKLSKSSTLKSASARELSLLISRAKTSLGSSIDEPAHRLLRSYESVLMSQGFHDFDDLLVKSYVRLKSDDIKRPNYKYVLVDEFQDTSELQYEIIKLLGAGNNLFAIGDPNQSIYAFRGAGVGMFDRFREDFSNTLEIDLTVNYRSSPQIIVLANAVFPNSPQLEGYHTKTGNVRAVQTLNEYSEAAYVLGEIEQGIGGSDMLKASGGQDVREPRDYAVLYRTHRAAKVLQRTFAEAGTPYQIAGEGSPYEKPEIQAVIAFMRCVHLPSEVNKAELVKHSILHRPSPPQLETLLVKHNKLKDSLVRDLGTGVAETLAFGQDDRRQDLQQFLGSLVQFGACETGLQACLDHIDNISESEFYDPTVNAVTLLTIHAAKGLEFANVYLIATQEDILPKYTKDGEGDIDEERRLFYVAVTRAKENLEILHTKNRAGEPNKLSRFVDEIPTALLPRNIDPNMATLERRANKHRQKRAQSSLF